MPDFAPFLPPPFLGYGVDMSEWRPGRIGQEVGWRATMRVNAMNGVPLLRPLYVEIALSHRDLQQQRDQNGRIDLLCNKIRTALMTLATALGENDTENKIAPPIA